MYKINTMDELVEYASRLADGSADFMPVVIEAKQLIVPLVIEGDQWDKRISATQAQYIVDLQSEVDALLEIYAPEELEKDAKPRIRAEIKDGSWEALQDFKEILTPLLAKMTDTQTFIAVMTAICGTCGYFILSRWLTHLSEVKDKEEARMQLAEHEETKRQMLQPLLNLADAEPETYARFERPVRRLIKSLDNDDSVALVGEGHIPVTDAKKIRPRKAKALEKKSVACDGDYQLVKTDYSLGEYILHLNQEGIPLKAYTSALDDADKRKLAQEIADKTSQEKALPFNMSLQVTVEYTEREIKHGVIVGFGAPREGRDHKSLSDLIEH